MHMKLMTFLLSLLLTACAQPQMEQPKPSGAYLVIDAGEARAVLVANGERQEEIGQVLDVVKLANPHSHILASYVIETPNCGRLQWLTERSEEGEITRLAVDLERSHRPNCYLAKVLVRHWTALDYSS